MKKYSRKASSIVSAVIAFAMAVTNGAGYLGDGPVVCAEGGISISEAADLQKIGTDEAYPLSGEDSYYDEYSKFISSKNQPLQFKNPEFIAAN